MKHSDIADEIALSLKALGRGSRQGHRPSAQEDFGVYTEDLRSVVTSYKRQLKSVDGASVYEIGLALVRQNVTESRQVAYELISGHEGSRKLLDQQRVEALGRGIDNWACVDLFCSFVAGQAWRDGQIGDSVILAWSDSPDLWWRRAAVVSTVALNTKSKGGTGDAERTIEVCQALIDDQEIMVQKAISWALRSLVPWDRSAVERFLKTNEAIISKRLVREVTKKLLTGTKNGKICQ